MRYGLIVGVLLLHLKRNGSNDSFSKSRVVHMILSITVKWYKVDKPTPDTSFFIYLYSANKK